MPARHGTVNAREAALFALRWCFAAPLRSSFCVDSPSELSSAPKVPWMSW